MAKKQAPVSMNVTVNFPGVVNITGTILSQDATSVTMSHKRPRSKTMLRSVFPIDQVVGIYAVGGDGGDTVVVKDNAVEYDAFEATIVDTDLPGFVAFEIESGTVTIRGDALQISAVDDGAEEAAPKAKAKAKAKPAAEDDDEEEEEAPKAKGKAKAKPVVEEEDEDEDAYTPEVGDRVNITDSEDEVTTGTVTAITAKMITIEDEDEEATKFKLAEVTVEAAPKAKAKAKAKPAAEPAPKAKAKAKAKPADEDDEEEEEAPKSKAKGKKAAADDGGEW